MKDRSMHKCGACGKHFRKDGSCPKCKPRTQFLKLRGESFAQIAENYRCLFGMCEEFCLNPLSGDLLSAAEYAKYCENLPRPGRPSKHGNTIVLLYGEEGATPQAVVGVLRVIQDGYFVSTIAGGNNDMTAGELHGTLDRAIKMLEGQETSPYKPGAIV
jgi:hypothetical protein